MQTIGKQTFKIIDHSLVFNFDKRHEEQVDLKQCLKVVIEMMLLIMTSFYYSCFKISV